MTFKLLVILFKLLFLGVITPLSAQITQHNTANQLMENAVYTADEVSMFSLGGNMAAITGYEKIAAAANIMGRHSLSELSFYKGRVIVPSAVGSWSGVYHYMGHGGWRESAFSLQYARKLGEQLSLGGGFNYHHLILPGYGRAESVSATVAMLYSINNQIITGLEVENFAGGKYTHFAHEKLPMVIKWGVGYQINQQVYLGASVNKIEQQPVALQFSIGYKIIDILLFRMGVEANQGIISSGLTLNKYNYQLFLSSSWHPQLGISPGVGLALNIKKIGP